MNVQRTEKEENIDFLVFVSHMQNIQHVQEIVSILYKVLDSEYVY